MLVTLTKVTHVAIITYPLFESVTLRRHALMNVVGVGYMSAWYVDRSLLSVIAFHSRKWYLQSRQRPKGI